MTAAAVGAVTAWALQCRVESGLLLPALALCGLGRGRERRPAWLLSLLGLIPALFVPALNVRARVPGYEFSAASALGALARHLPGNLLFYLAPGRFALLAAAAVGAAALPKARPARLFAVLAAGFWPFNGADHIGDFASADSARYTLVVDLALLPLAGAGWAWLWARQQRAAAALWLAAAFLPFPRPADVDAKLNSPTPSCARTRASSRPTSGSSPSTRRP